MGSGRRRLAGCRGVFSRSWTRCGPPAHDRWSVAAACDRPDVRLVVRRGNPALSTDFTGSLGLSQRASTAHLAEAWRYAGGCGIVFVRPLTCRLGSPACRPIGCRCPGSSTSSITTRTAVSSISLLSGTVVVYVDGDEVSARRGTVIYLPPGCFTRFATSARMRSTSSTV
jgi:hypothetical protein